MGRLFTFRHLLFWDLEMETIRLYVGGVHCANCLKKINSLQNSLQGLEEISFDMSTNTLKALVDPEKLADLDLQNAVDDLGFQSRPLERDESTDRISKQQDRMDLIRIGVAAVAAANVMLMAISVYSGANTTEANFMNFLSLLLAIPAITFAAWPIHRTALKDLWMARVSVDLPISFAIIAGFILSSWSLLRGNEHIYFDSISALIFLVLSSRYLLKRVQRKYLGLSRFQNLFQIENVEKLVGNLWIPTDMRTLNPGDLVKVASGHIVPADGVLAEDPTIQSTTRAAIIDSSLLSGESRPSNVQLGETLFLGMKNLGGEIVLKISKRFVDSRLNQMLLEVEKAVQAKPRSVQILDKVGQVFLLIVFAVAAATFLYFYSSDPFEGSRRALALILVACPCTFAFGAPLVFSLSMSKAAKLGALIKHPNVFEKLGEIQNIILDKTGTLTNGQYDIQDFKVLDDAVDGAFTEDLAKALFLCEQSEHPVSRAMARKLREYGIKPPPTLQMNFRETPTLGLFGDVDDVQYKINSEGIWRNNIQLVSAQMGDRLWPESSKLILSLKKLGFPVFLLSGDSELRVSELAKDLGLNPTHVFSAQTPELKQEFVKLAPRSLMVGDGANDSIALAAAHVGIAVHGSLSTSLQAADVYLLKQDLGLIPKLFSISKKVQQVLRRNLYIAGTYNLIAGTMAVMGLIHPLMAAILMPLSSLSQLLSGLSVLRGEK